LFELVRDGRRRLRRRRQSAMRRRFACRRRAEMALGSLSGAHGVEAQMPPQPQQLEVRGRPATQLERGVGMRAGVCEVRQRRIRERHRIGALENLRAGNGNESRPKGKIGHCEGKVHHFQDQKCVEKIKK
jgi:hypothetical protein